MKCYVKFYYDWIEQTAALSEAERGRLFIAILEYARSGQVMDSAGRESLLFPVFKSILDRDALSSTVKAENGSKGGKQKVANDSKRKQKVANDSNVKPTKDIRHKTEDKENKTEDYNPLIPLETHSEELKSAVRDWLDYKKERRENYKPTGLNNLIGQIRNKAQSFGDAAVAECIRTSMSSNYAGIVFDRLERMVKQSPNSVKAPAVHNHPKKTLEEFERIAKEMSI